MTLGLHLIETPSGAYQFVGSVPYQLGFVTKAGNIATPEEVEAQHMLPASYRTIKTRTFSSPDEAWREAKRIGAVK